MDTVFSNILTGKNKKTQNWKQTKSFLKREMCITINAITKKLLKVTNLVRSYHFCKWVQLLSVSSSDFAVRLINTTIKSSLFLSNTLTTLSKTHWLLRKLLKSIKIVDSLKNICWKSVDALKKKNKKNRIKFSVASGFSNMLYVKKEKLGNSGN